MRGVGISLISLAPGEARGLTFFFWLGSKPWKQVVTVQPKYKISRITILCLHILENWGLLASVPEIRRHTAKQETWTCDQLVEPQTAYTRQFSVDIE